MVWPVRQGSGLTGQTGLWQPCTVQLSRTICVRLCLSQCMCMWGGGKGGERREGRGGRDGEGGEGCTLSSLLMVICG